MNSPSAVTNVSRRAVFSRGATMNHHAPADHVASIDEVSRTWPFLDEDEIRSIDGRVDRLYRALLSHRLSRGDAASQIQRFVRRGAGEGARLSR
jgi:hypothetical protein